MCDTCGCNLTPGNRQFAYKPVEPGATTVSVLKGLLQKNDDQATHNLEWAPLVRNKSNGKETVNYNVRILGRRGVTEATLLVSPDKFEAQLPWFRSALTGFSYVQGEDYASFRQGDRIAEYGLAALVTGGVVAAAAKSGLLGRLWKFIILGIAGLGAFLKKLFGGGDKQEQTSVVAADQQNQDDQNRQG